jgi:hypothetical protein
MIGGETVVSGPLNVVKGTKRTNTIVSSDRSRHMTSFGNNSGKDLFSQRPQYSEVPTLCYFDPFNLGIYPTSRRSSLTLEVSLSKEVRRETEAEGGGSSIAPYLSRSWINSNSFVPGIPSSEIIKFPSESFT